MKTKLATICFAAGALLAPFAVNAVEPPVAYANDSVITTKVKSKLAAEKMSSLTRISVKTDNKGAVVLSGNAPSQEAIDKAVTIARATDGVTSVNSNIQIKTAADIKQAQEKALRKNNRDGQAN